MDFSEKWGKDVDEAVRLALIDLNLSPGEVDVIVLEEPTKGFFGLGSKLAKVRVEKKKPIVENKIEKSKVEPPAAKKEAEPPKKADFNAKPKVNVEHEKVKEEEESAKKYSTKFLMSERPEDLKEVSNNAALDFLKEVITQMGLTLQMKAFENDSFLFIEIDGKDSGTIIGKRGQTLDAIQYLTSLVVNKNKDKYVRVVVDAENYRAKREKTLEQLANRLAGKVLSTGKSVRLEPMNPYERKVIHATLQQNQKVITKSEGEEPFRRVVIGKKN